MKFQAIFCYVPTGKEKFISAGDFAHTYMYVIALCSSAMKKKCNEGFSSDILKQISKSPSFLRLEIISPSTCNLWE